MFEMCIVAAFCLPFVNYGNPWEAYDEGCFLIFVLFLSLKKIYLFLCTIVNTHTR